MVSNRDVSFTHHKVVSCEDAAKARGIKLDLELKSILMQSKFHTFAVHIRGSDKINSKHVKLAVNSKSLRFLRVEELAVYNLHSGLINPWNIEFCDYHLLCEKIFKNEFMTTNNGTFTQGVKFSPNELKTLKHVKTGAFSC
jgi:prolyl-tRNA editing enzyme YbaK/EbsC (Cys-tRNA(Pro) deacylase)